jgi:uncharacterized protein
MKRMLVEIAGWSFIVLGIAGLFLPVLQGILFLLIGLTILSANHHWARRWLIRLRERFPQADRQMKRFLRKHFRHIPGVDSPAGR